MRNPQAVIVGAGPAGLGAAVELVRRGVTPVMLDENPAPGGQIYKRPAAGVDAARLALRLESYQLGQTLFAEVGAVWGAVQYLPAACVIGIFDNLEMTYTRGEAVECLRPDTILLALGAYDRVVPFPGWELPGVITVGGLQSLLKHHGILPGRRIVLAGSGLLTLLVAAQMTAAGHPPAVLIEATGRRDLLPALPALLHKPSMLREGRYLWRTLRRGGVRVLQRHAVLRARGAQQVEAIEVASVDQNWKPNASQTETIQTDCLAIGFGLVPEVSLARLAGAAFDYRAEIGGWVPRYNHDMETDRAGVFVAGDGCGIRGAEIAQLQGRLAGMAMADRLGMAQRRDDKAARRRLQENLEHRIRARQGLDRVFQIRPGIYDTIDDDTLLCRCEEISWSQACSWLDRGINSATQLKMASRIGMGRCQGRFCGPNLRDLLARQLGERADLDDSLTVRPPVRPVALGRLAEMTEE